MILQNLEELLEQIEYLPNEGKSNLVCGAIGDAIRGGYAKCLKLLLGAINNIQDITLENKIKLIGNEAIRVVVQSDYKECLDSLLNYINSIEGITSGNKIHLIGKHAIHVAAQKGYIECLDSLLNYINSIEGITSEDKIQLIGNSVIHVAAKNGHAACLSLLLEYINSIEGITSDDKIQLIGNHAIRTASFYDNKECLDSLLNYINSIEGITLVNKILLIGGKAIPLAAKDGHPECLDLLLNYINSIEGITLVNKILLIGGKAIPLAAKDGYPECLDLLLNYINSIEGITLVNKILLIVEDVILDAALNGHKECLELLLNYIDKIQDITPDKKADLIGPYAIDVAAEKGQTECIFVILNFLAKNGISKINNIPVWSHVQKHNLEAKSYELWESTKTWEDMDEVNNMLLSNQELGLRFFSDIVCYMAQNGKAIDREIIPKHKQEIFDDICKLISGDKDEYKHKIFKDIASLDLVNDEGEVIITNSDKINSAISILTMDPDDVAKLLLNFNDTRDAEGNIEKIVRGGENRQIEPSFLLKAVLQSLKYDESLARILLKFGDKIKEVLLNPMQKLDATTRTDGLEKNFTSENHGKAEASFQETETGSIVALPSEVHDV